MGIFHQIINNFVLSLKVLQPLMATAGVCELCLLLATLSIVSRSLMLTSEGSVQITRMLFACLWISCMSSIQTAVVNMNSYN